jgi:hypothetical protein
LSKILRTSALPHFSAIHSGNHARTSSLAADMSFATLCLTWFIVQLATHAAHHSPISQDTLDEDYSIGILFKDQTYLGFDIEPFLRITPDYSDWKTHNYRRIKRWPPLRSE